MRSVELIEMKTKLIGGVEILDQQLGFDREANVGEAAHIETGQRLLTGTLRRPCTDPACQVDIFPPAVPWIIANLQ